MKQLFHIQNENNSSGQQVLSLRLGEKHVSFAITDGAATSLYSLGYCTTDGWNENELGELFLSYPGLNGPFAEIRIAFDFPQTTMVSSTAFRSADASIILKAAGYNCSAENVVAELAAEWQLYTVYTVPAGLREGLLKRLPSAVFVHQYSLGLKSLVMVNGQDNLLVDFRKNEFTVIATRGNKFLLAQSFDYVTPADVLYWLLKICQEFSLSQQEVQLQLSGLIDRESALYKELYQYFIGIEFREAGWEISQEYPEHFFTSLNDLAKCVL